MTNTSRKHNPSLTQIARNLRKNMTKEESILWYNYLHKLPLRFLRQKVIDNYIVDFYCSKARLIIEVDGSQHFTKTGVLKDRIRTEYLEKRNLTIIRISNYDINQNFNAVCEYIDNFISDKS